MIRMSEIKTYQDVLALWDSYKVLSQKIGASEDRIRKWATRDSIPPEWWPSLILASPRGARLSAKKLMEIAASRRPVGAE